MPLSKTSKRLKRLAESGICSTDDVSKYADDLKKLANTTISVESAEKKGRFFKALADEIRLRILSLLATREMCVCGHGCLGFDATYGIAPSGNLGDCGTGEAQKRGKVGFLPFIRPLANQEYAQAEYSVIAC
jgi:hypothetical protein